jgi:hypothetical protein
LLIEGKNLINLKRFFLIFIFSGVCKCCNGKLQSFDLTEEEFKDLQTYIIKNIIVGKDVFSKTTPEELLRFKHFVSNMDKYDVVIDGLNVGYSAGVKQTTMVFSALVGCHYYYYGYYKVIINVSNIVSGCALYLGAPLRQLDVRNIYNNPV